jgi:hypothetical protein
MKVKGKFNIIDFFIIVAIVGCVAGVFMRYDLATKIGLNSNKDEVEISFVVVGLREGSTEALVEGDTIYWEQNGMEIGKLVSKEISEAVHYILDDNYEYQKQYNKIRFDVRGVISSKGNMTDGGFMLNGTQFIAPGKELKIQSKNISTTVTVTAVKHISG